MSRTDKTKPMWVRIAEHHPVEDHDHRAGICDLPSTPYEEADLPWSAHHCRWTYSTTDLNGCCFGCNCSTCNPDKSARRRRERYDAKRQIAAELQGMATNKERWPAFKNTKKNCKGKRGRKHTPRITWSYWARWRLDRHGVACCPSNWNTDGWTCYHQLSCDRCGKILIPFLPKEQCPTWLTRKSARAEESTR